VKGISNRVKVLRLNAVLPINLNFVTMIVPGTVPGIFEVGRGGDEGWSRLLGGDGGAGVTGAGSGAGEVEGGGITFCGNDVGGRGRVWARLGTTVMPIVCVRAKFAFRQMLSTTILRPRPFCPKL